MEEFSQAFPLGTDTQRYGQLTSIERGRIARLVHEGVFQGEIAAAIWIQPGNHFTTIAPQWPRRRLPGMLHRMPDSKPLYSFACPTQSGQSGIRRLAGSVGLPLRIK